MATIQQFVLIILHQVVSHACRNISDLTPADLVSNHVANIEHSLLPIKDYLDDDGQKFEDIRHLLHVVPFQEIRKWKSNYSRGLPTIRNHNAAPIAIILAPSNIAAQLQQKRNKNKQDSEHVDDSHRGRINMKEIYENKHEYNSETDLKTIPQNVFQMNNYSKEGTSVQNRSNIENSEEKKISNNNIFIDVEDQDYSSFVTDKNILQDDPERNGMIEKSLQFILEDLPQDPENAGHNTQNSKEIAVDSQSDEMKEEQNKVLKVTGKEQNMLTNRRILDPSNPLNSEKKTNQKVTGLKIIKDSANSKHNTSDEGKDVERKEKLNNIQSDDNVNDEINIKYYNKDKIHLNPYMDGINYKEAARRQNGTLKIYNLSFLFQK